MKQYLNIINSVSNQLDCYSPLVLEQDFKDYVGVSIDSYKKKLKNISIGLKGWKLPDEKLGPVNEPDLHLNTLWFRANESFKISEVKFPWSNELSTLSVSELIQINETNRFKVNKLAQINEFNSFRNNRWVDKAEVYQEFINLFALNGIIDHNYDSFLSVENDINNITTYYTEQGLEVHDYLDINEFYHALYWQNQYGEDWIEVYVALQSFRAGYAILNDIESIIFHGRETIFCRTPSRLFLYEYYDLVFTVKWLNPRSNLGKIKLFHNFKHQINEQERYKHAA